MWCTTGICCFGVDYQLWATSYGLQAMADSFPDQVHKELDELCVQNKEQLYIVQSTKVD